MKVNTAWINLHLQSSLPSLHSKKLIKRLNFDLWISPLTPGEDQRISKCLPDAYWLCPPYCFHDATTFDPTPPIMQLNGTFYMTPSGLSSQTPPEPCYVKKKCLDLVLMCAASLRRPYGEEVKGHINIWGTTSECRIAFLLFCWDWMRENNQTRSGNFKCVCQRDVFVIV